MLFILFFDIVVREALAGVKGVRVAFRGSGRSAGLQGVELWLAVLLFADDLVLLADSEEELRAAVSALKAACDRWKLVINFPKTKVMSCFGEEGSSSEGSSGSEEDSAIKDLAVCSGPLADLGIDQVREFKYLGSMMGQGGSWAREVDRRVGLAAGVFKGLTKPLWDSAVVPLRIKLRVFRGAVLGVLLYGAEAWTLGRRDLAALDTFYNRCLRRLAGISAFQCVPYLLVRDHLEVPPLGAFLSMHRLRWLGHLLRLPPDAPPRRALTSAQGAPRTAGGISWWSVVVADLAKVGLEVEEAEGLVGNKKRWGGFARSALVLAREEEIDEAVRERERRAELEELSAEVRRVFPQWLCPPGGVSGVAGGGEGPVEGLAGSPGRASSSVVA